MVEEVPRLPGKATELTANSVVLTPDSVVVKEVPKFPAQAKEHATSGVPNPDLEALGCLNEGSEKALDVQLHEALLNGHRREDPERAAEFSHGVTQVFIAVLLRWVLSLDDNLRQKLCEYILPNGEKAGKRYSKGNLPESSHAPNAKRKKRAGPNLVGSKNSTGVRQRSKSFSSRIHLPGTRKNLWLGTFKTEKAAVQAHDAAANWLATHSGTKLLDYQGRNELKKCAKEAGEHLSDDLSHHNVASPDLASAEHVSQGESSEVPFSPTEFFVEDSDLC